MNSTFYLELESGREIPVHCLGELEDSSFSHAFGTEKGECWIAIYKYTYNDKELTKEQIDEVEAGVKCNMKDWEYEMLKEYGERQREYREYAAELREEAQRENRRLDNFVGNKSVVKGWSNL